MTSDLLKPLTLRLPNSIESGPGCAAEAIGRTMRAQGARRVLVVTSPSVRAAVEAMIPSWRTDGAAVEIFSAVPPEPSAAVCESARSHARGLAPDLVVAVGGGSVLDLGKLVAALHDRSEPVTAFYGIGRVAGRRTALLCVPTTAGTGSEVSPNALVRDDATGSKQAVISPCLVPDGAIIDPGLMVSLPPALTATTGIDALSHCLEAYVNRAAHPMVDRIALEGVRLVASHLVRAVEEGSDLEARSGMAAGSLYGGLCLGPVNTAGVHALAYPLAGEFHLPHGLSIALLLPHVIRFNLPAMVGRHAMLARVLGVQSDDDTGAAAQLPDRVQELISACGIPTGLGRHGVTRDAIPRLAAAALKVTRLLRNNPREIDAAAAESIYREAF